LKIVIVGAGEVGFHIAQRLALENKEVVVIDRRPEALKRIAESLDVQALEGSGSSPRILEEAGLKDADILLAVTDSDETNIIACMFANSLAPNIIKLARIRNEEYTAFTETLRGELLNIGMVINPEVEVVKTIQRMITMPGAVDVSEFAKGRLKLVGVKIRDDSPLAGMKLKDLRSLIGDLRLIVGAIIREDSLIIPGGQDGLQADDITYVVAEDMHIEQALKTFGCPSEPVKNALIVGGGNIGFRLARAFEKDGLHTKLVEHDPERCRHLSETLDRTVVLEGDGTDQELLVQENVRNMDVFIALTGDEETNILSSMLAKKLGCRRTITRIDKAAYMPLARAIGLELIASPRLSAIDSILHFARMGKVISTVSLKGDEAEVLEVIAEDRSKIVNKPIKDIPFPKAAVILCIQRGNDIIIPTGNSIIKPQDRIVILSTRANIPKVEKALTVKVEKY